MIELFLEYDFLRNAVFACILSSIVCGIIGVIIVEKKMIMMTGGISHTAYGGVGLGYLMGFPPILGAVIFGVASAFGIGHVKNKGKGDFDIAIALFWSLGMALGIIFVGLMDGYPPDINSYLFGNILAVSSFDIVIMFIMALIVTAVIFVFFNDWKEFLFDEEFSKIMGLKTTFLNYLLLILIALTIVVLIKVSGIILVLALLTAPAATSMNICKTLKSRMILSIVLGLVFCSIGLVVSYIFDISSGATIVLIASMTYFISGRICRA